MRSFPSNKTSAARHCLFAVALALTPALPLNAQPVAAPDPTLASAELEALRRASAIDKSSMAILKGDLDAALQKLEARTREVAELQKDLESAQKATAAALAAQTAAAQAMPDAQAAQLEIETLRAQIHQLETKAEQESKRAADDVSALAAQLNAVKEANKALNEANRTLSEARGSTEGSYKVTIEGLQQKAVELTAALEKTQAEFAELKAKYSEAEKGLETQAGSIAELTHLNEKLGAEKKALEEQIAKLRPALEKATGDIEGFRTRANAESAQVQRQGDQLDTLSRDNERLTAELAKARTELDTLRADVVRLTPAAAAQVELTETRAKLSETDKALEAQASTVAELTHMTEQLKADKASLQQQLAAQSAQSATLGNDLSVARNEANALRADAARVSALQQENAALAARLRQAQATLDQIAANARIIASGQASLPQQGSTAYAPARPGTPALSAPSRTAPAAAPAPAPTPAPAPAVRYHTVTDGDSLSKISQRYYGTANRWQDIYEANRAVLRGENALRPGQKLRIP